ncbi:hypothetical protein [Bradyrhizobium sp.]|uniref:hypothetical protein n=1 Tax=Bradyrhizobium sp. TaxID=376 RepID=UPI0040376FBB
MSDEPGPRQRSRLSHGAKNSGRAPDGARPDDLDRATGKQNSQGRRENVRSREKVTGHVHDERRAIYYVKETIMIAAVMLMSVALVGALCVIAYTLATFALPLMLGFAAARFAHYTGSGLIGAGLIGLIAAAAGFALFAVLFARLRSPIPRLVVALIFAAPAAIAGYALVHGVTHEAIPSAIWRQTFFIIGGAFVGVSALMRLAGSKNSSGFVRTID